MRRTLALLTLSLLACGDVSGPASIGTLDAARDATDARADSQPGDGATPDDATADAAEDVPIELDSGAPPTDGALDPDAACAAKSVPATAQALPVDIIWMVDNSASMKPAVDAVTAGLNDFAAKIGAKGLDYKVVMLSLRSKTSPITVSGSTRYPVCIPPPLAGDADCGDGPHFVHDALDVKSTQPLEQFLGTLGQTTGYTSVDTRGAAPWRGALRDGATKTIVIVTDDNSRLSASDFETFVGGTNPNNSGLKLPPGILDPSWKGLFTDYVFSSIYGWGSDVDPGVTCTYSGGAVPPASGAVYTTLVSKTGGVRAKICDGAPAWGPFFDAVATAVVKTSKIACDMAIPTPSSGTLDPGAVNVQVTAAGTSTPVLKVANAAACGAGPGWYYDDDLNPTKVILCPTSCDDANKVVGAAKGGSIEVLFGCKTIIR
jgi:hypothetical protein